MNPVTRALTASTLAGSGVIAREAGGVDQPTVMPSNHSSTLGWNVTWQKRFASGGLNSQPSAARSGGFAPATTRTPSGRTRSPTTRSNATASIAACTAGVVVVNSSNSRIPALGLREALRPSRGRQGHPAVVADDRQPGHIGRLPDRTEHRFARHPLRGGRDPARGRTSPCRGH